MSAELGTATVAIEADLEPVLAAMDVLIDEWSKARDRIRERLAALEVQS